MVALAGARRERRAERLARRPTRASRVVVEESARPSPLKAHRRRHGAGPLDAAGDLVANGWPRPVDADGT